MSEDSSSEVGDDQHLGSYEDGSEDQEGATDGFFDLEAEDEKSNDNRDENSDDQYDELMRMYEPRGGDDVGRSFHRPFHQFVRLPIELRHRIWHCFCPALADKGRIFEFILEKSSVNEGPCVGRQTEAFRRVAAVHQESRTLALKSAPDKVTFNHGLSDLRFRADTDVVFVPRERHDFPLSNECIRFRGFFDAIENLAIENSHFLEDFLEEPPLWVLSNSLNSFPRLKTLFLCYGDEECHPAHLRWCISDNARTYAMNTRDDTWQPLDFDVWDTFCWPNLSKRSQFAVEDIPFAALGTGTSEGLPLDTDSIRRDVSRYTRSRPDPSSDDETGGVETWPMIRFEGIAGAQVHEKLKTWDGDLEKWSLFGDSGDDEPNEYESSGIDDSDIDDSTVPEDDLFVYHGSLEQASLDFEGGFSPIDNSESIPSSVTEGDDADDDDSSGEARTRLRSRRRRVVESEDDSGSEAEREGNSKNGTGRRRTGTLVNESDSDSDEAESSESQSKRHSRATLRGSDGDSDEGSDATVGSDASVDDASSSQDERPARPSLAERLRRHAEENPLPDDEDSERGSGSEAEREGDYASDDWGDDGEHDMNDGDELEFQGPTANTGDDDW